MIKFGSLFSGIGGLDLGLERAGMECLWQVEIDDYCQRVLNEHWPDVSKFGEVRDVGKENLETVDLIAGGFPCQPHSVAGKRKGAEDDRNLWPEFIRIIREIKPKYVLAENVPGIITTYIDTVLSDLENEGYICATFNIPAIAFDAPHRRYRIFIVAYRNRTRKLQPQRLEQEEWGRLGNKQESLAYDDQQRYQASGRGGTQGADGRKRRSKKYLHSPSLSSNDSRGKVWAAEPNVGRVAHGVPNRVDRLKGLGNAVVPQVAEWIGRRIIEFDEFS